MVDVEIIVTLLVRPLVQQLVRPLVQVTLVSQNAWDTAVVILVLLTVIPVVLHGVPDVREDVVLNVLERVVLVDVQVVTVVVVMVMAVGDVVPAVIAVLEIVMVVKANVQAVVLLDAKDVVVTAYPVVLVPPLVTRSVIQVLAP